MQFDCDVCRQSGDVVVVASAGQPPLSLLLLRRLAPAVHLTAHVHSTCPTVPAELSGAFSWRGAQGAAHVRVIWKPGTRRHRHNLQ